MTDTSSGQSLPLFDICINLDNPQFDIDREALLQRATAAGVTHLGLTGCSLESSRFAVHWAEQQPTRYCATAGIHPHGAEQATPKVMQEIEQLLSHPQVRAVGECGLDYNRNFSPRIAQISCFEAHIELANRHKYPLFLHQRDAHSDFMTCMDSCEQPAVVHCFTDTEEALLEYLKRGWYIGITGWICDPKRGAHLREIVHHIPLDRIMIETDAPWLLPKDMRPKPKKRRNEPAYLPHILQVLAGCMNTTPQELARHSFANSYSFFQMHNQHESITDNRK
jgi:TatD DNase family protein